MNRQFFTFAMLIFMISPINSYAQSLFCGFKPFPHVGCHIGRCVNGKWEQVCGSSSVGSSRSGVLSPSAIDSVSRVPQSKPIDIMGAYNRGVQSRQNRELNEQRKRLNQQQIEMNQQQIEMMRRQDEYNRQQEAAPLVEKDEWEVVPLVEERQREAVEYEVNNVNVQQSESYLMKLRLRAASGDVSAMKEMEIAFPEEASAIYRSQEKGRQYRERNQMPNQAPEVNTSDTTVAPKTTESLPLQTVIHPTAMNSDEENHIIKNKVWVSSLSTSGNNNYIGVVTAESNNDISFGYRCTTRDLDDSEEGKGYEIIVEKMTGSPFHIDQQYKLKMQIDTDPVFYADAIGLGGISLKISKEKSMYSLLESSLVNGQEIKIDLPSNNGVSLSNVFTLNGVGEVIKKTRSVCNP